MSIQISEAMINQSGVTREGIPPLPYRLAIIGKHGIELPIEVCAEHLTLLGASSESEHLGEDRNSLTTSQTGSIVLRPPSRDAATSSGDELHCALNWQRANGRDQKTFSAEPVVQALSGLMEVNGREGRKPRRLGLDVASVAAGIIATQGLLAALIARSRGLRIREVETSVLHAALFFISHHLAIATCGDKFPSAPLESAPGPPFRTADGHWIELEVLTFDAWKAFWSRFGITDGEADAGWYGFVFRYLAGKAALPASMHQVTEQRTLEELRQAAEASGVAICRLRSYSELLARKGWDESAGRDRDFTLDLEEPWTLRPGDSYNTPKVEPRPDADAPLAGLRVVEATSRLQGPLAGLLLRMLGAEVIKVEPPGGDIGRVAPAGRLRASYLAYNRGKKPVEIDYKRSAGRDEFMDLIAGADVFVHNWRMGRAEKIGLDFDHLSMKRAGLVYAYASGWGSISDPPSQIAGDFMVQAHSGCGYGLNPIDEPPFPSRLTLVDVIGGLLACEGILAALYLRERTGRSCRVDTSLVGGAMALQSHVLRAIATGQEMGRSQGRPLWGPLDKPIETADGFLVIGIEDQSMLRRLSMVCDLATTDDEERLEEKICERLRSGSAVEWESLLSEAGIPAAVVNRDLASLPRDPHVAGLLERAENGSWVPANPWQFKQ